MKKREWWYIREYDNNKVCVTELKGRYLPEEKGVRKTIGDFKSREEAHLYLAQHKEGD